MNKVLLPSSILLLTVWIVAGTFWYSQNYCGFAITSLKNNVSAPLFYVRDGQFKASSNAIFSFKFSDDKVKVPVETQDALKNVANYINKNEERKLILSGQFASIEKNTTSFENLGLARAAMIKTKLVENGASADRIELEGVRFDNTRFENSKLIGGVNFTFADIVIDEEAKEDEVLAEASISIPKSKKDKSVKKVVQTNNKVVQSGPMEVIPLNIYFSSASTKYEIEMIPALKSYLNEISAFLEANPKSKVKVIGHSDNKGNYNYNVRVSKYRARAVRDFLIENGFSNDKIDISWKGPDEPLFDNETDEGRKKNRRVEIRVK